MARFAVGNRDDALDIVQDAMFALVRKYQNRPDTEWRPLFFTILNNRITDWHRRHKTVSRWQLLLERLPVDSLDDPFDPGELPDATGERPEQSFISQRALGSIDSAVEQLPLRQQQAFLLRCVEGFDVAETARAMTCSTGSVKTHLSRALASLRRQLEHMQ